MTSEIEQEEMIHFVENCPCGECCACHLAPPCFHCMLVKDPDVKNEP